LSVTQNSFVGWTEAKLKPNVFGLPVLGTALLVSNLQNYNKRTGGGASGRMDGEMLD